MTLKRMRWSLSLISAIVFVGLASATVTSAADRQKLLHLPLHLRETRKSRQDFGRMHGVSRAHLNSLIEYDVYRHADDVYIMAVLHLGTGKTPIHVGLDSGSSHLYVINDGIGYEGFAEDFQEADRPGTLNYLDGSVRGRYGSTSVWVSGENVQSKNHEFLAVDSYDSLMKTNLLGLAKGFDGYDNIFEKFKKNGLIDEVCFSITPVQGGLKLIVGGLDEALISPTSIRADVRLDSPDGGFWFSVDSAYFGEDLLFEGGVKSILDTGNTFISLPESCREKVLNRLSDEGHKCFTIDEDNPSFTYLICQEHYKPLPDFRFVIQGKSFLVKSKDLKIQCLEYMWENFAYKDFSDPSKRYCEYKLEFQYESEYLTLGKAFIQLNYITFYQDRQQVTIIQNRD